MNTILNSPRPTERPCGWCSTPIAIVRRPGRARIYCDPTCRQRAYERRRGLGVVPPPPDRIIMQPGGPIPQLPARVNGYEAGRIRLLRGRSHAVRPAGFSEKGDRRLSLCGLLVSPLPRAFSAVAHDSCKTCTKIENIRPSARPVRPSVDLAALRAVLDQAAVDAARSSSSERAARPADEILHDLLFAA